MSLPRSRPIHVHQGTFVKVLFVVSLLAVLTFLVWQYGRETTDLEGVISPSKPASRAATKHRLFMSGLGGRFGNELFQFAAVYAIARRFGLDPVLGSSLSVWEVFDGLRVRREPATEWAPIMSERAYATYDRQFEHRPPISMDMRLEGYFQSWKYFQDCKEEIREQLLKFKPNVEVRARQFHAGLRDRLRPGTRVVGVNVRRGDKVYSRIYRVATISYLKNAIEYFRARHRGHVHFVVCSNGIWWCKTALKGTANVTMSTKRSFAVDFAILAKCDDIIMTVGSFGWWAGWLAGGAVVYYKHFAVTNSSIYAELTKADHFLPTWVPMGD